MFEKTKIGTFGFLTIASVTPEVEIANPYANVRSIMKALQSEELLSADIIVMPELSISGYTAGDLFFQSSLLDDCIKALVNLCDYMASDDRLLAVGLPVEFEGQLYNCAAVLCRGQILGIVPKTHIPNYQEFYEKRWFTSGKDIKNRVITVGDRLSRIGTDLIFNCLGAKVGVEICEDLWVPVPPSSNLALNGAEVILNLSATDDNIGKFNYIKSLVASQSGRCRCVYAYASAGTGESSTDLVFSGIDLIAYDGRVISQSQRFSRRMKYALATIDIERLRNDRKKYSTFYSKDAGYSYTVIDSDAKATANDLPLLKIDAHPFVPENPVERDENCSEIIEIQSWGLAQRLSAIHCKEIVVGVSGGLDSTLALLIAHHTFKNMGLDLKGIKAVTMPADATSSRTLTNSRKLMNELGVTFMEIPIMEAVNRHFKDISHNPDTHDIVYENSQARERTQILMDLANKFNGIVLGTGDMSELALGWCTYNGDQISMYNVNAGVPKTLVKYLVKWFADHAPSPLKSVLEDILATPISPELVPTENGEEISQKTENLIGPYELHDFFLFHVVRNGFSPSKIMFMAKKAFQQQYSEEVLKKWLVNFYRRFFSQQFKRSCMPDGPKVGSVCLSPRGDWRMPSDASAAMWLEEAKSL